MMKKHIIFVVTLLIMVFSAIGSTSIPATAEPGDGGGGGDHIIDIWIYHNYYIPYAPGMDNCYGIYRILSSRGYQFKTNFTVQRHVSAGKYLIGNNDMVSPPETNMTDYVAMFNDSRRIYRDDIMVLTTLEPGKCLSAGPYEKIEMVDRYRYHHIHMYYWETPLAFVGMMADMAPDTGSQAVDIVGKPYTIMVDLNLIQKYTPDFNKTVLVPNYKGSAFANTITYNYNSWEYKKFPYGTVVKKYTNLPKDEYGRGLFYRYPIYGLKRNEKISFFYILSMNKDNADIADISGWWELFSYETLSHIDNIKKMDTTDKQMGYDGHSTPTTPKDPSKTPTATPEMDAAMAWKGVDIKYANDDINDYVYLTKLNEVKQRAVSENPATWISNNGIFRWFSVPSQKTTDQCWKNTTNKIREEVKANVSQNKSMALPWTASSYPLAMLQSTQPGAWNVPKSEMMENKTMMIHSSNPELIGASPFTSAQASLYYALSYTLTQCKACGHVESGKVSKCPECGSTNIRITSSGWDGVKKPKGWAPTIAGVSDSYQAMSNFMGINVGRNTNYLGAFRNKIANTPSLNVNWNDPWLPYGGNTTGGLWRYWYSKDNALYKQIVPMMAMDPGMALWELNDSSNITAWGLGVKRVREKRGVIRTAPGSRKYIESQSVQINQSANFNSSKQSELKSRGYTDDTTFKTRAGEVAKNSVMYISGFKKLPIQNYGDTRVVGSNSFSISSPMTIRYFPVFTSGIGKIKNRFSGLGSIIAVPDYSPHEALWKMFELPKAAQSGVNLKPAMWR